MEAALKKDRSGCILYIYVDFWFATVNHDLPLRHISILENEKLYSVEIFIHLCNEDFRYTLDVTI